MRKSTPLVCQIQVVIVVVACHVGTYTNATKADDDFYRHCEIWSKVVAGGTDHDDAWERCSKLKTLLEKSHFTNADMEQHRRAGEKTLDAAMLTLYKIARIRGTTPNNLDLFLKGIKRAAQEEKDRDSGTVLPFIERAIDEVHMANLRTEYRRQLRQLNVHFLKFIHADIGNYVGPECTEPLPNSIRRSWPGVWESEDVDLWNPTGRDLKDAMVLIAMSSGDNKWAVTNHADNWKQGAQLNIKFPRTDSGYIPGNWVGPYQKMSVFIISRQACLQYEIDDVQKQHDKWVEKYIAKVNAQVKYLPLKPGVLWGTIPRGAEFTTSKLMPAKNVVVRFHYSSQPSHGIQWDVSKLSAWSHKYRDERFKTAPRSITVEVNLRESNYRPTWTLQTPSVARLDRSN